MKDLINNHKVVLTVENYRQLNNVLTKMVLNSLITDEEREAFLNKSQLTKIDREKWKCPDGSILKFNIT